MSEPPPPGDRPDPFSYWGAAAVAVVLASALWLFLAFFSSFFFLGGQIAFGPLLLALVALGLAAKARGEAKARSGRSLAWGITVGWVLLLLALLLAVPKPHWAFG